ncbi:hypothetical protein FOFC_07726 [Fusarium oxysporum]|nr:hypothetical protein FOFC_07726 [Fusarium oxysporum]
MVTAHWVASLVPQPTAWHHRGHGKKAQISMERRLSVRPMARYGTPKSGSRGSPATSHIAWCRSHD